MPMEPFLVLDGPGTVLHGASFFVVHLRNGTQFTAIELDSDYKLAKIIVPYKPKLVDLAGYPQLFSDLRAAFPSQRNTERVIGAKPVHPRSIDVSSTTHPSRGAVWGRRPMVWWELTVKLDGPALIAYTHSTRSDGIMFVPTTVKRGILYSANVPEGYGELAVNRGIGGLIRLDLIGRHPFPRLSTLRRFNLGLACTDTPPAASYIRTRPDPPGSRDYIAMDGTLFSDRTNLHIMRYKPYQNKTYPLVAGCHLTEGAQGTDPFYFTGNQFVFIEKPELLQMFEYPFSGCPRVFHIIPGLYRKVEGKALISYDAVPPSKSVLVVPPVL